MLNISLICSNTSSDLMILLILEYEKSMSTKALSNSGVSSLQSLNILLSFLKALIIFSLFNSLKFDLWFVKFMWNDEINA